MSATHEIVAHGAVFAHLLLTQLTSGLPLKLSKCLLVGIDFLLASELLAIKLQFLMMSLSFSLHQPLASFLAPSAQCGLPGLFVFASTKSNLMDSGYLIYILKD